MDLYSGFCNICYKTYDVSLQDTSEENMKNLVDSLITFVGHADIVKHNIVHLCQLCCKQLTRYNKFREKCFITLMQLQQNIFHKKSKLQDFCNMYYKTDDRCLKDASVENTKNINDTLITFVGHADIINDKIINLCQSCFEELTSSTNFREMCLTNLIQLRQSVIDMKSKLEFKDGTFAVQNTLQIFVHEEVLRRYILQKRICPVSVPAGYEITARFPVSSNNDAVFNRQIINLQSIKNECLFSGDCSDASVIISAAECDESQIAFKNEGLGFAKCEIESDEDLEYTKEEFDVKSKVELINFEYESSGHVNEAMINSKSKYKEEELYVKQESDEGFECTKKEFYVRNEIELDDSEDFALRNCETGGHVSEGIECKTEQLCVKQENSAEYLDLQTTEDEFGDGQSVTFEFLNVCKNVKLEECETKSIAIEENDQDDMDLLSRCCNNKLSAAIMNAQPSHSHVQEHRNGTALQPGAHKHVCTVCKKTFRARSWLKRHARIHSGDKPYKCTICHMAFAEPATLSSHQRRHSGERPYKCPVCKKAYTCSSSFTAHKRIHNDDKPRICIVCNKEFTQLFDLIRHERTHSDNTPYECTVCNKTVLDAFALTKHKCRYTGERPFKCGFCNMAFRNLPTLTDHERLHQSDRSYKCTICNKSFLYSSRLVVHERLHSGERPYKCSMCKKAFTRSSHLTRHERIHSTDRPNKCSFCNKTFVESYTLNAHERSHTGDKPYKCTYCNKAFAYSSSFTKHRRTHS